MKVLKNNYNITEEHSEQIVKPYPRTHICEMCQSELEYTESDLRMGAYGCMYVDCPCCGYDNMLDDNENNIVLTSDNIEFPTHFHHTSKETGAIDICNDARISQEIKRAISFFRQNKNEFHWHMRCGNLNISVCRYSGDEMYDVIITNDYYAMDIPFEDKDY